MARMAHRRTRYVVELHGPHAGVRYHVGVTAQVSRAGLLKVAQSAGDAIIAVAGIAPDAELTFSARGAWGMPEIIISNGWIIRFTGETEKHNPAPWPDVRTAARQHTTTTKTRKD